MVGSNMDSNRVADPTFKVTLKVLSAVWGASLLGWVALLAVEWYLTGPAACPLNSTSSIYGTEQWSWLPPGRSCSWELPGGTHTDGPPTARVGILLLFALWGLSLLLLRRRKEGSFS